MSDDPFGRQPKPVTVTISGEREDILYWMREFIPFAQSRGWTGSFNCIRTANSFVIYPRAVND